MLILLLKYTMEGNFKSHIEQVLNNHVGLKLNFNWQSVGGGSINDSYKINAHNKTFFLNTNIKSAFKNGFKEEVLGLNFLKNNGVLIPEIIVEDTFEDHIYLILTWIDEGFKTVRFWKNFALQLASLHRQSSNYFGLSYSNFMGSLPQRNTFKNNFADFFIESRLQPQIVLAINSGKLQYKHVHQFEKLFKEIPSLFPIEKPSAVHGDLWSGNFICNTEENAVFIDPAVYYGHREIDLAMSTLFGGFSKVFYEYYQEIHPLEKGFQNRKNYYNLYPLLIHLNLFGGAYLNNIESIITKF